MLLQKCLSLHSNEPQDLPPFEGKNPLLGLLPRKLPLRRMWGPFSISWDCSEQISKQSPGWKLPSALQMEILMSSFLALGLGFLTGESKSEVPNIRAAREVFPNIPA